MKKNKLLKRTASYINKHLDEFEQLLVLGYTHENFSEIKKCLGKISCHLTLPELKTLESIWRDVYVDNYDPVLLEITLTEIRDRL